MFEQRHIGIWVEKKGDICPAEGEAHKVGPIEVSEPIRRIIHARQIAAQALEDCYRNTADLIENSKRQRRLQRMLQKVLTLERTTEVAAGASKVTVKAGGRLAAKLSCAECSALAVGKFIPFASLFFGVAFATKRAYDGQPLKAVGELASGIIATIPGVGTVISGGIDTVLIVDDVLEMTSGKTSTPPTLEGALFILGLNEILEPGEKPTKKQVDEAFASRLLDITPDKLDEEYSESDLILLRRTLDEAKQFLYTEYGYTSDTLDKEDAK